MSARPPKPKTTSDKCWIEHGCWRETPKVGLKMWNPPRSLSGQQQSVSWPVPIFPPHLISQTYKPSARAADSFFMLIQDMTDSPAGQFDSISSNIDSDHHKDLGHGQWSPIKLLDWSHRHNHFYFWDVSVTRESKGLSNHLELMHI